MTKSQYENIKSCIEEISYLTYKFMDGSFYIYMNHDSKYENTYVRIKHEMFENYTREYLIGMIFKTTRNFVIKRTNIELQPIINQRN